MAKKMIEFDHAVIYGGKYYPANTPIEAIKEPKKQDEKQDEKKQNNEPDNKGDNEPDNQDDKEGKANDE